MTVNNLEHRAVFEGDVVMMQGDLSISADHAELMFASKGSPSEESSTNGLFSDPPDFSENEIRLIHATGNVVLQQGDKEVRSKEAFYYHKEDKVVLLGEPVASEKGYRVTGTKMTIFLQENRSVIEGSKVVIHPKDQ
jgi:lipopolysaccharide export system protein LptA